MELTSALESFGPFAVSAAMAGWFVLALKSGTLVWGTDHRRVLDQLDTATAESARVAAEQLELARAERQEARTELRELRTRLMEREGS